MAINEPITEPPGMFFGMIRGAAMDKAKEDYVDEAFYRANHILQETAEYCRKKKIMVSYEVLKGHPAEAILEFSKKKNIGLIIMGSRGHHGIRKLKILGIVSRHVVENATCPVMIIHQLQFEANNFPTMIKKWEKFLFYHHTIILVDDTDSLRKKF